jgi:hypothetical protein
MLQRPVGQFPLTVLVEWQIWKKHIKRASICQFE